VLTIYTAQELVALTIGADGTVVLASGLSASGVSGGNDVAIYTVPEPSTLALLGAGALGLIGWWWRRRQLA
jgi:hypothetical protein